jgi:hypothetical protein
VILRQIRVEPRRLRLASAEHLPLQWPQLRQELLQLCLRGRRQSGQPGRKTRTSAPLTRWQLYPTSRFELVEERACRHVFDLTGSIVPMPPSAQFQGQTAAAPIRLIGNQTTPCLSGLLTNPIFGLYGQAGPGASSGHD